MCVCVCVCVCVHHNLRWMDIWEPGGETQQRLRREAMSKPGHGTYYWCLHGLHIRGNSNHWLQLDATATPLPMPEVHAGSTSLDLQPIVLQEQQPYCRATRDASEQGRANYWWCLQRQCIRGSLHLQLCPGQQVHAPPHVECHKVSSDLTLRASDLATWELLLSN